MRGMNRRRGSKQNHKSASRNPRSSSSLSLVEKLEDRRLLSAISGTVFQDINANGEQDVGDTGLPGQTVFVDTNNNGILEAGEKAAITDGSGVYTLTALPAGTYPVRVVVANPTLQTLPAGGTASSVTVDGTNDSAGNDFGITSPGIIAGHVFYDPNANGQIDLGETGFPTMRVFIDANGNGTFDAGETQTTTNAMGQYAFSGISAGAYTVAVEPLSGYDMTYPQAMPGKGSYRPVTLPTGQAATNVNFGQRRQDSGFLFRPVDYPVADAILSSNSIAEGSTTPITMTPNGTARTDNSMITHPIVRYEWDMNYDGQKFDVDKSIQEGSPLNVQFSAAGLNGPQTRIIGLRMYDETGAVSNVMQITIPVLDVAPTVQIQGVPNAAPLGYVVNLTSSVSDPGPGETFSYHWVVRDPNSAVVCDLTTPNISFIPTIRGSYSVTLDVTDSDGQVGHAVANVAAKRPFGSIVGVLFNDLNGNGAYNKKERVLAGRMVYVDFNGNRIKDPGEPGALTNAAGIYTLSEIHIGNYVVRPLLPKFWRTSGPPVGYRIVTVGPEETTFGQTFGITQTCAVSGTVFNDRNRNRKQGSNESGLYGWRAYIDANNDGKWQKNEKSARTSKQGVYSITGIKAGKYALRVVVPAKYQLTAPKEGWYSLTLGKGKALSKKNFGVRKIR